MELTLNIGCKNNSFFPNGDRVGGHVDELVAVINCLFNGKCRIKFYLSEYDGQDEDTAIVLVNCNEELPQIGVVNRTARLCEILSQECIAIKTNDSGCLVWNPNEKPKFDFCEEYFVNWE